MIQIIKAEQEHFTIIESIAYQTWPVTFGDILSETQINYMLKMMYSQEALQEQVSVKNHVFYLAKENDDYLGYVSYQLDYKGVNQAKIHKIYLLPASQGRGVGQLLIAKVRDIAIQHNQAKLTLNVNRYNKAVGFYEKIGFKVTATEDIDIGEGFLMEDFVMEMSFEASLISHG
jgi:diamine N-acetyltransferase